MSNQSDKEASGLKIVCKNRKARHLYEILEEYEAGIVLSGTEVKSLRDGKVSLPESYATIRGGEVYLVGCHIDEYIPGNRYNHDPLRDRKLLLARQQIRKLAASTAEKGIDAGADKYLFQEWLGQSENRSGTRKESF